MVNRHVLWDRIASLTKLNRFLANFRFFARCGWLFYALFMTETVLSRCDVREQKFQSPPLSALAELIKWVRVANVDFHFQWFPVGFIWNWRHVLRIVK